MDSSQEISSNNVKSLDYDPVLKNLTIVFSRRPEWKYIHHNVPQQAYSSMKSHFSLGRYYHIILKRKYPKFTLIKPEDATKAKTS